MTIQSREAERLHDVLQDSAVAFSYFDGDDRLLFWNDAYLALNFKIRHLIEVGAYFPDLLTELVMAGQIEMPAHKVEGWLANRLTLRREGTCALRRLSDDRIFLVQERRDSVRGTLGFWVEVTKLVQDGTLMPTDELPPGVSDPLVEPDCQHLLRTKLHTVLLTLETLKQTGMSSDAEDAIDNALSAVDFMRGILDVERHFQP